MSLEVRKEPEEAFQVIPEDFGRFFDTDNYMLDDGKYPKHTHTKVPRFSIDWNAAMLVHRTACDWLLSRRRAYLDELARLCQTQKADGTERDYLVAWPDALIFLDAEKICRAALKATLANTGQKEEPS